MFTVYMHNYVFLANDRHLGMFAFHDEREYVEGKDFMKAVCKVSGSKKVETKLDYKQLTYYKTVLYNVIYILSL